MINSLPTSGIPCFGDGAGAINDLNQCVFLYGPNGSGKSSIARAMQDQEDDTREIALFDQRFVSRLLSEDTQIPGVFTIRDGTPETQDRIDELSGSKGEIARWEREVDGLRKSIMREEESISLATETLKDACWEKKSEVPESLGFAFAGFNSSKQKHLDHVFSVNDDGKPEIALNDLVRDAETLSGDAPTEATLIPLPPQLAELAPEQFRLLEDPVASASETSFSEFVANLGNVDWVDGGRRYLADSDGHCPFCQQTVSASLSEALTNLFDQQYEQTVELIRDLEGLASESCARFQRYRDSIELDSSDSHNGIEAKLSNLAKALELRLKSVQSKLESPSKSVSLDDIGPVTDELQTAISLANEVTARQLELLSDRKRAVARITTDVWQYYVANIVATDLATYRGACVAPQKALDSMQPKLELAERTLQELRDELNGLQEKLTSSELVVRRINTTLASLGFHNFQISKQDGLDVYDLRRNDGSNAASNLSEGERTLISFLYYYHETTGKAKDNSDARDLVAVIDDPVSSLDSETLFLISLLVRDIYSLSNTNGGRLAQVILLTHSAYFFKEVTFTPRGTSPGQRTYLVIRKDKDGMSLVESHPENPIKTTYTLLWDEVKRANANQAEQSVTLQNSMRRIIENYFGIMGGIDNELVYRDLEADEQWACRSLMSWINDGSHTAPWDVDYSTVSFDTSQYLNTFKKIFESTKQIEHYNMMMQEQT